MTPPSTMANPRCPYCSFELISLQMFNWHSQGGLVFCVYCPNPDCNKALSFSMLPTAFFNQPAPDAGKSIIDA